jgi:dTDP-4-dehydrorhamnose 3,5-epimerase
VGEHAQAKLVRVLKGEVLDVAVDLRKGSPTFGEHVSFLLSADNKRQLFIPRGFAHGFVTLSGTAEFFYKCDNFYHKEAEGGIIYNDPTLAVDWRTPTEEIIVSSKDKALPTLNNASL